MSFVDSERSVELFELFLQDAAIETGKQLGILFSFPVVTQVLIETDKNISLTILRGIYTDFRAQIKEAVLRLPEDRGMLTLEFFVSDEPIKVDISVQKAKFLDMCLKVYLQFIEDELNG